MDSNAVVPFKKTTGLSPELLDRLCLQGKKYGIHDITLFSVEKIVIAQWVHLKCRYGCRQHDSSWCCPPATPGPEEARAIVAEYTTALLFEQRQCNFDFYRNNSRKRKQQVAGWKGIISMERILFLEGYRKVFALVGECCALCKECSYPEKCRFPQEKRPSVESFSIDLIGTLGNIGKKSFVAKNKGEAFNTYGIILLD
jgi:predicted metal-binding protein